MMFIVNPSEVQGSAIQEVKDLVTLKGISSSAVNDIGKVTIEIGGICFPRVDKDTGNLSEKDASDFLKEANTDDPNTLSPQQFVDYLACFKNDSDKKEKLLRSYLENKKVPEKLITGFLDGHNQRLGSLLKNSMDSVLDSFGGEVRDPDIKYSYFIKDDKVHDKLVLCPPLVIKNKDTGEEHFYFSVNMEWQYG